MEAGTLRIVLYLTLDPKLVDVNAIVEAGSAVPR